MTFLMFSEKITIYKMIKFDMCILKSDTIEIQKILLVICLKKGK